MYSTIMVRAPFQETSVVFCNEGSYWFMKQCINMPLTVIINTKCYQPQSLASVGNTYLNLDYLPGYTKGIKMCR